MANNTVDPKLRGLTKFGRGISQVTGSATTPKRGGEVGLTRIRESFVITASSVSTAVTICDQAMELVEVREIHSVVGGSGCVITIEKLTGTTAPGSGTALTAATSLTSTINTMQSIALTGTAAQVKFAAGDSVSFKFGGTMTGLQGAVVLVFRRV